jgi:hypothetical protein
MKTNQLTRAQLDWAVAKCEAFECRLSGTTMIFDGTEVGDDDEIRYVHYVYSPSYSWAQGGPIIEREKIGLLHVENTLPHQRWDAGETDELPNALWAIACGPTPLIAAMRCYVASKLGDEVDIPQELTG